MSHEPNCGSQGIVSFYPHVPDVAMAPHLGHTLCTFQFNTQVLFFFWYMNWCWVELHGNIMCNRARSKSVYFYWSVHSKACVLGVFFYGKKKRSLSLVIHPFKNGQTWSWTLIRDLLYTNEGKNCADILLGEICPSLLIRVVASLPQMTKEQDK